MVGEFEWCETYVHEILKEFLAILARTLKAESEWVPGPSNLQGGALDSYLIPSPTFEYHVAVFTIPSTLKSSPNPSSNPDVSI